MFTPGSSEKFAFQPAICCLPALRCATPLPSRISKGTSLRLHHVPPQGAPVRQASADLSARSSAYVLPNRRVFAVMIELQPNAQSLMKGTIGLESRIYKWKMNEFDNYDHIFCKT
jgi:hypothetical protein